MGYQYDIFISYRRDKQTRTWVNRHFIPTLEHLINMELGRMPIIYIDEQMEAGTTWPIALGNALGRSRTIIPLWSKTFLHSRWCSHEISHMLERETTTGCRTLEKPDGLVFPTIIHDGETIPLQLASIQRVEIQDCFNALMSIDSPKAEELYERLRPLGTMIAKAISEAPAWQAQWSQTLASSLFEQFYQDATAQQVTTPQFITL